MVGGRKSRSKPFGLRLGIGCLDQQAGCWLGIDREAEACWIQKLGPARFSVFKSSGSWTLAASEPAHLKSVDSCMV